MFVTSQIVTALLILGAYLLLFGHSPARVIKGLILGVAANIATFFALVFLRNKIDLYGVDHNAAFCAKYSIVVLAIGVIGIVVSGLAFGNLRFVRKDSPWRWRQIFSSLAGAVLAGLAGAFILFPRWLYHAVGEIPKDPNFVIILTTGNDQTTDAQDVSIMNELIAPILMITLLGAAVGFIRSDLVYYRNGARKPLRFKAVRPVALLLIAAVFSASFIFVSVQLPVAAAARQLFVTSTYVEDNYVAPSDEILAMPSKKRNLVHIYMESMENSFYSRDIGGYMEQNLMPELAELSKKGVSFSNTDMQGGPTQLYAMGHSVAGMVAMQAGVPMLAAGAPRGGLSYPGFETIGDILQKEGYVNYFMQAANAQWGRLDEYYERHGNFDIFDHQRFIQEGKIPFDYMVWWGIEDDKLYEYSKEKLAELGAGDDPFYMIIENGDTHFPDGYVSENMTEMPFDSQYANVIHYSQAQIVELVEWILAQPWGDDTTIVLTGDHRSMDKEFFKGWDPNYERTIVNLILNPVQGTDLPDSVTKNRAWSSVDMFPTILSALGAQIEGERLGLGTNMFSGKETLVERDGAEFMNEQFAIRSPFYDANRETRFAAPDTNQDNKF
ncbi:MAG: LTA synthase family protein [Actinomycetaceae bacterium]|nr:LTA synthase family protein [Actinomycetaceae bacterium]